MEKYMKAIKHNHLRVVIVYYIHVVIHPLFYRSIGLAIL